MVEVALFVNALITELLAAAAAMPHGVEEVAQVKLPAAAYATSISSR